MKIRSLKTLGTFALALLAASPVYAAPTYELTTLLGTANERMPYVQEIVKSHVPLAPGNNFEDFTTGVLYFAWRNGTASAQTIQVLREAGNATMPDIKRAIDLAAETSALVLAPLGGDEIEEMCGWMAEKPNTAFLITLGAEGYNLSPLYTKCSAQNILLVTTLNESLTDVGTYSSYGPLVRLAVPGTDLSAPVDGDRRVSYISDAFGMAVAAGKMSEYLRRNPDKSGAALIRGFLEEADTLPALRGKVRGSKAVLRFER